MTAETQSPAEGRKVHRVSVCQFCPRCGARSYYSPYVMEGSGDVGYDARFCIACDVWLESSCGGGPECPCGSRPHRPSEVPYPLVVE